MRDRISTAACCCVFVVMSAIAAHADDIQISTFDDGLEGWRPHDSGSAISWGLSGGNPGGYLHHEDLVNPNEFVLAPLRFLGDWSLLDGAGSLSYDHRIFAAGAVANFEPYRVEIGGPGGAATWIGAMPIGATDWSRVTVPLDRSNWSISRGTWDSLLRDVTSLAIAVELVHNDGPPLDVSGIDNVRLSDTSICLGSP